MRTKALLSAIALPALAACAGSHASDAQSSPGPGSSPAPLRSCEERRLTVDGADVFLQANIDGTPAQVVILSAPTADDRAKAYADARKMFGDPHPDTRTQTRQYKYGLVQTTDMCGRPVMPSTGPSATPSPG
jgi:hypothetical protein